MNETRVNRTQDEEARVRGTVGNEAMEGETQVVGNEVEEDGGVDVELLRRAHLKAMLTELVRQEGPTKAAEMLGVNYKTVARSLKSGRVTVHMSDALERLLGLEDDPEAGWQRERMGALEESVKRLEGGVEAMGRELRGGLEELRSAVAGGGTGDGSGPQRKADDEEVAGRSETRAATSLEPGPRPRERARLRRLDPEIVTEEAAEDDQENFGSAWPLVEEWRRLRDGHPTQGRTLSWLTNEERLLVLELAMLEEHGLTLPPEKQPLRGFGRRGQTTHRWTALDDTRARLRRRKMLRWVRRVLTLWLWRK